MGCWNESCSLSNLPIFDGEEIVLVIVQATAEGKHFVGQRHAEIFAPVGLPFYGTYNDYGSINLDPSCVDYHNTVFRSFVDTDSFTGDIDMWLHQISTGEYAMNSGEAYTQVMFKRSIFDAILPEVGKERGGWGDNAGPHSERLMKVINEAVATFSLPTPEDEIEAIRHEFTVLYHAENNLRHYFRHSSPAPFLKPENASQMTIEGAYRLSLLDIALMRLRRNWTPLHGTGTQDTGTTIQKALLAASLAEVERIDADNNYDED